MKLKVCGMREPENIRALAELKPDFMGFIFYPPSPRFAEEMLDPMTVKRLPKSTSKVGVFVNETVSTLADRVRRFGLTHVQLHGNESPAYVNVLKATLPDVRIIKVFRIGTLTDEIAIDKFEQADLFLFDTKTTLYGGSGKRFDWNLLFHFPIAKPFFLSGGIDPHSIRHLQEFQHPFLLGIDINSGFEQAPGRKDISKISTFKDQLNATI